MADEGFKRKLAAILSADVEGYSRLMDDDEEATVRTLTSYRNGITDLTQQFRGRVVDAPGDNILAEFTSVVDAVNCAVEIQRELSERNEELTENRKMQFRIGVNLGDVIEEDGRIYGDGVNIAARVEALAEAGGISISGRAFDQVENKLGLEYENLGEHEVKNIARPIRVYRILSYPGAAAHRVVQAKAAIGRKWHKLAISAAVVIAIIGGLAIWQLYIRRPAVEPASVEKMTFPLPEKPSIAVLPFVNMSGDLEQEYIADSITENIITALSYIPELFVISRTSTSVYKGKAVKIKQVSEELGVRYVLEGSIQKADNQIRVTAQLIDAISGHHLWAERYDRAMDDFFYLLDEIAKRVAIELQVELTEGDIARISHKTDNFDAWAYATTAYGLTKKLSRENIIKAKELCEKAIKLDPSYGFAWSVFGAAHGVDAIFGWGKSRAESFKLAVEYTDKALRIDDTLSCATAVKGRLLVGQGQLEQAIDVGNRAIEMAPSHNLSYGHLSVTMYHAGRYEESISLIEKAIRLDPHYPAWYLDVLAYDYYHTEKYEEAVEAWSRLLERSRTGEHTPFNAHLGLAAAYIELGRAEKALAHATEVLELNPKFALASFAKTRRYKNKDDLDRYIAALRKAGLPDTPPLPLPDKPSIAVLAFDNLSGDPEQEYFSDGISEEIINALAKTDQLFVIARNSSFIYKGKSVNVKQVSRELGVRYVLEGSVRKSEDRIRITAQLIEATTGHHLWSERYDRDLKDIFAVQDEITMKLATALQIELSEGEQMRMMAKGYKTLDVLLKAMELLSLWREGTVESHMRHGQVAQEVIDMAPDVALGYRSLGWYHWFLAGIGRSPQKNLKKAYELAQKAISLDESDAYSHAVLGSVYSSMRQYENAVAAAKRSVELNPNGAMVHLLFGQALNWAGRPDEAIAQTKKGIRLNPFPSYLYYDGLAQAYLQKGQYDKALIEIQKALRLAPEAPWVIGALATIYSLLDRQEEARAAAAKCVELAPFVSVSFISKNPRYKNQAHNTLIVDAMRKAGFPETATSQQPDKQQAAVQDSPQGKGASATAMNNSMAINLIGEWDAVWDLKEYGVSKDVIQITLNGNKFKGIKLIGTQYAPKGSEAIKGDIDDQRIKSFFLKNVQGWAPAEWRVNEQGNTIILKQHIESMDLTIDVTLTRK